MGLVYQHVCPGHPHAVASGRLRQRELAGASGLTPMGAMLPAFTASACHRGSRTFCREKRGSLWVFPIKFREPWISFLVPRVGPAGTCYGVAGATQPCTPLPTPQCPPDSSAPRYPLPGSFVWLQVSLSSPPEGLGTSPVSCAVVSASVSWPRCGGAGFAAPPVPPAWLLWGGGVGMCPSRWEDPPTP